MPGRLDLQLLDGGDSCPAGVPALSSHGLAEHVPAGWSSAAALDALGPHLKVPGGEVGCANHRGQVSLGAGHDVQDHLIGRRDLAVAVMPGVLGKLQQVQCGAEVPSARTLSVRRGQDRRESTPASRCRSEFCLSFFTLRLAVRQSA